MRRTVQALLGDAPAFTLLIAVVALALTAHTRQYVAVFASDLTLGEYAVTRAPQKPRVLNNYGVALVNAGRWTEARAAFTRAVRAGSAPHLPPWDRVEGRQGAAANLQVLTDLEQLAQAWPGGAR